MKNKESEYFIIEKGRKGLNFPLGVQNVKLKQANSNLVCFVNPNSCTRCFVNQTFSFHATMFLKKWFIPKLDYKGIF